MTDEQRAGDGSGARRAERDLEASERRAARATGAFMLAIMLAALVMPFVYRRKELDGWTTVLQVALWLVFSASWMLLGHLVERSGNGVFAAATQRPRTRGFGTRLEIGIFLLALAPACFAYVHVTFGNTGYLGFNYILLFVVAGLSTYVFPVWIVLLFLLLETFGWALLGRAMWGGWMRADDLVMALSGYMFSAMMFLLLRKEADSRRRAEALTRRLDDANEQLREYSAQVEELSATRERNRIAREIHDTLGHALTVVNMQLETARALVGSDAEKSAAFLEKAQAMTRKGLADVRASVASLRASPLEGRSLELCLRGLLEPARAAGLSASFAVKGESRPLGEAVEAALYRSVQEGLTNVRKHARARSVSLELDYAREGAVTLILRDDGVGCESLDGGFGLVGIRERIQLLDGETAISTAPGKGLELTIRVRA